MLRFVRTHVRRLDTLTTRRVGHWRVCQPQPTPRSALRASTSSSFSSLLFLGSESHTSLCLRVLPWATSDHNACDTVSNINTDGLAEMAAAAAYVTAKLAEAVSII